MEFKEGQYIVTCFSQDETQAIFELVKMEKHEIYFGCTDPEELSQLMWKNSDILKHGDCSLSISYGDVTGYCWKAWFRREQEYRDYIFTTAGEFLAQCGVTQSCDVSALL